VGVQEEKCRGAGRRSLKRMSTSSLSAQR